MATNATTWFYREPEHRAYFIEERVNHTFWSNRINGLYLNCTSETSPFKVEGEWNGLPLAMEWVPNQYLRLALTPADGIEPLVTGVKEILGFEPTVSYGDGGQRVYEWLVTGADERLRELQSDPRYQNVMRTKKQ
jgi:hypothetical protein